jgi:hypothetical protein
VDAPFPQPAVRPEPSPPPPPVATEPKPAAGDDWRDELDPDDEEDAEVAGGAGWPEARLRDGEHVLDPGVAKSVRHEAETLRRAADRRLR